MTTRPKRDIPGAVRTEVLAALCCHYCGDALLPREVEHRIPLSRGGTNDVGNLVAACVACNSQKKAMLVSEWRAYRITHGMPWPPLASHPTNPDHYRDRCERCAHRFDLSDIEEPDHHFIVTPFAMLLTDDGYWCHYRCPAGHSWRCWHSIGLGYFSDSVHVLTAGTSGRTTATSTGLRRSPTRGWSRAA